MTSSAAPLIDEEPKKSNPIVKWTLRLVLVFVGFVVISLVAMNALTGTGDAQKSSIESILHDMFKGDAVINNFNQFSALPYVSIEIENVTVADKKVKTKLLMGADYFAFQTGLINILLQRPSFLKLEVRNFYAAPGTLTPKALIIDYIKPIKGTNKLSAKGQYSKLPFEFTIDVSPHNNGTDLTYGYKLKKSFTLTGMIDELAIKTQLTNKPDGLYLDDIIISQSDTELLTGGAKLNIGRISKLLANLSLDGAAIQTELTHTALSKDKTTKKADKTASEDSKAESETDAAPKAVEIEVATPDTLSGYIKLKNFDLASLTTNDRTTYIMRNALNDIVSKLNAPIDKIYQDAAAQASVSKSYFPDIDMNVDVELRDLTMNNAVLGDLTFPVALKDKDLSIRPITGQINEGALTGVIKLIEGKDQLLSYSHDLRLQQWNFGQLLTAMKVNHSDVIGKANFDSKITAKEATLAKLTDKMNGDFRFVIADAEMKSGIINKLMGGLLTVLMPKLTAETKSKINCVIGNFAIKDGIAQSEALFVDTERAQIVGEGHIDLKEGIYKMNLVPKAKKTTLLDITPSINVSGPLAKPQFTPDALSLGSKIGGALLGIVNPVFLVATLTDFSFSKEHSCYQSFESKVEE